MKRIARISLKARHLPLGHRVYVLHPGESKKFYGDMIEEESVFLDLPGARFPKNMDWDSDEAAARVRFGRENAQWLSSPARQRREDRPTLASQRTDRRIAAARRSVYFSQARELYGEAKAGELVVVPGPGYLSRVFIGELTEPPGHMEHAITDRYPKARIPARRVRWLSRDQRKARFSDQLIVAMQNRRALTRIFRESDQRHIYDLAYGTYTIGDDGISHIHMGKEEIDPRAISRSNDLIVYFASLFCAVKRDEVPKFLGLEFYKAIDEYYDPTIFAGTSVEINSPGLIGIKTRNAVAPLFVSALLALTSGSSAQKPDDVEIGDEASVADAEPDECEIQVRDELSAMLEHLNLGEWKLWCEKNQQAKEESGLSSTMTVQMEEVPDSNDSE